MKPLSNRVVIRPDEAETKTASGIIIPDTAVEKPKRGTVLYVGPGMDGEKMQVKVKDKVLYSKYSGSELELKGEALIVMRETDIIAIV